MAATKSNESCSMPVLEDVLAVLRANNVAAAAFEQGQITAVSFFPPATDDAGTPTVTERKPSELLSPGMKNAFEILKGKVPPRNEAEG